MSDDAGIWFELWPGGEQIGEPERYRGRAEAEQAATALLIRRPELRFVEVAERALGGSRSGGRVVRRVAGAQPPVPAEAEVDDLHKLPRGDPEC